MPVTLPAADERRFASLVTEALARLPRLAPAWTDYNAHDPGITLIELLAALTESDLYRLARVTAAERRAFLRWFGLEAGGPTVAATVVAFAPPSGAGPVSVAADREIASAPGDVVFSTTEPVTIQQAGIAGLFAGARQIWSPPAGSAGVVAMLPEPAAPFGTGGTDPFTIALDRAPTGEMSLYVWTGAPDHDDGARTRLQGEIAALLRDRKRARHACPPSRLDDWRRHYEVDIGWKAYTSDGWVAVPVIEDRMRALTMSGFVQLRLDRALITGGVAAMPGAFALQACPTRGRFEAPPSVKAVLLNAAPARHQGHAFSAWVGTSDGAAGQRFRVPPTANPAASPPELTVPEPGAPLVFDVSQVTVAPPAAPEGPWRVATDWDRAGPDDPVVVIDAETGTLSFGDGRCGRVPPVGSVIHLASRLGGGAAGNVPSATLTRAAAASGQPALAAVQPFAARGGGPAPEIADLQARLLADLAHPTRAITLADIEQLARETPGVCVARAYAVAEHHPDLPNLVAPGCVSVVVVPQAPGPRFDPTPGFLAAVRAYLGRRRPLTTELHVIGPKVVVIAVRARLHLTPQADAASVVAQSTSQLDAFFNPLTGGTDGSGWPVGRDVYRSEVLALLQDLPGVHHVDALALLSGRERAALCGNAAVCPTDLVAAGPHELTIAPARIR
jgi:predicted phage baseplate assembly protein